VECNKHLFSALFMALFQSFEVCRGFTCASNKKS
jgi:hypothetical protein